TSTTPEGGEENTTQKRNKDKKVEKKKRVFRWGRLGEGAQTQRNRGEKTPPPAVMPKPTRVGSAIPRISVVRCVRSACALNVPSFQDASEEFRNVHRTHS